MRPLGAVVGRLLRTLGLEPELAEAAAVERWPDAVSRVLGPDARATRALRVERHTIVVAVDDAQWASELRLRERDVLAALEAVAPASGITRIRPVPARDDTHRSSSSG